MFLKNSQQHTLETKGYHKYRPRQECCQKKENCQIPMYSATASVLQINKKTLLDILESD